MPLSRVLALLLVLALVATAPAHADALRDVRIEGVKDEQMLDNIRGALSLERLNPKRRQSLSQSRLAYLLRRAPRETRQALEAFGYYDVQVQPRIERDGDQLDVVLAVTLGEPVRVRESRIAIDGPGRDEKSLARLIKRFEPAVGQPFHHGIYEQNRDGISRGLEELGFFEAELVTRQVTVTRAERSADIDLAWTSGPRFAHGPATFEGHPFRPGMLDRLVPWQPGDPFDQARLRDLQASLVALDYFSGVDIRPLPEQAVDGQVPVQVNLVPSKRTVYSAGVRSGTDTGLGVTLGLDRRWVNDRGHKLRTLASLAQRRNDITSQYKIPAFAWLDGWYTASASLRDEQVANVDSRLVELVGSRSGRLGRWTLTAALNLRRERFQDALTGQDFAYSTLVFPSLLAQWSDNDGELYPERAHGLRVELSGGSDAIGSDVDFVQLRTEGLMIRSFAERHRLLLRAEAGTTVTNQFDQFPPSLRFFAGGDRSVRGYGYKEIGQVIVLPSGERVVLGGKHLLVASVEVERMFTAQWGGAAFVDVGDTFDSLDLVDWQVGLGVGVRWRSPVGPVRLDLAHGLGDDARQSIRLHLNIGPNL
jgi:translocation and assembly module TamA